MTLKTERPPQSKPVLPDPERRPWRPLAMLRFRRETLIPGVKIRVTTIVAGESISLSEPQVTAPQPYFDADLRMVVIRDHFYPLDSVESFTFARAAVKD